MVLSRQILAIKHRRLILPEVNVEKLFVLQEESSASSARNQLHENYHVGLACCVFRLKKKKKESKTTETSFTDVNLLVDLTYLRKFT